MKNDAPRHHHPPLRNTPHANDCPPNGEKQNQKALSDDTKSIPLQPFFYSITGVRAYFSGKNKRDGMSFLVS